MGRAIGYPKEFNDEVTWHTIGYSSTLSRDVVKEVVHYEELSDLVKSPIKFRNFVTYTDFRALNEDIMVGEVIRNKLKFEGLPTVDMKECHYVMHAKDAAGEFGKEQIIVIHHFRGEDYVALLETKRVSSHAVVVTGLTWLDDRWAVFNC